MFRLATALVAIPFLLVALLTVAVSAWEGSLGSVTNETFELGLGPIVVFAALVLLFIFVPLLLLVSRFAKLNVWNTMLVGLVSALLPALVAAWPLLSNGTLRPTFRFERLVIYYPWLGIGVVGGLLFWALALFRNREVEQYTSTKANDESCNRPDER